MTDKGRQSSSAASASRASSASSSTTTPDDSTITQRTFTYLIDLFRLRRKIPPSKRMEPEFLCKMFDLTPAELSGLQDAFDSFDLNHDGFVSDVELGQMFKSMGEEFTEKELKEMIEAIDEDQSGDVDFYEFLKMMTKSKNDATYKAELRELFRVFDTNRDGYISAVELRNAMKMVGEDLSDQEIALMMNYADTDRDGRISIEGKHLRNTIDQQII